LLHNKEEGQKRAFNEGSTVKLQKYRCTERNRYKQMLLDEKEMFLQKKRDAARNRYWRMSGEERAKILQMKGDANKNRYREMARGEIFYSLKPKPPTCLGYHRLW
jgi:hypothetical protein